jgi:hypothetical protein
MGYVMATIGPLQENSSFRNFAEWAQSKEQYITGGTSLWLAEAFGRPEFSG